MPITIDRITPSITLGLNGTAGHTAAFLPFLMRKTVRSYLDLTITKQSQEAVRSLNDTSS